MNSDILEANEQTEIARTRAAFSSFLTIHFNVLPDEKFVSQMRHKDIITMLDMVSKDKAAHKELVNGASLMHDFIEATKSDKVGQISEKLGVDRTRLYRGISPTYGPPPPYEMIWSKTWQDINLLQVLAGIYRENELGPSPEIIDRMDYLGLELEFIHALATREVEAWEAGEVDKAVSLLEIQKKFFNVHMEEWIPSFVQKALEFAKTDFYRGHLLMLSGFIYEQAELFAQKSV